ncbi:MAG: hypothetical protein JNL79_18140, partial [Myxococcales bacterium]|nr:hypothetical protein [Myxococcales bacterium]
MLRQTRSLFALLLVACGSSDGEVTTTDDGGTAADGATDTGSAADVTPTDPDAGPPAGNPDGKCDVPAEAKAEDTTTPRTVVGTGTKESCTGAAFVAAVAKGGVIKFDCGPDPV